MRPPFGPKTQRIMFTEQDLEQIKAHGLTPEQVGAQIACFENGFPYLGIRRAATVGDGIVRPTDEEAVRWRETYRRERERKEIVKFVPASGAATRMFKDLFGYLADGEANDNVREVIERIDRFAFADRLFAATGGDRTPQRLVAAIVGEGLHYGSSPKALVLFHRYGDLARTALEEHLSEGALYGTGANRTVRIHLTVSPEHREAFEQLVGRVAERYEEHYGVKYEIGFSYQNPSTDTIAVAPDNRPFRNEKGRLVFRPAGHGALIENLDAIDADIVFIKTVDNVVPDRLKTDTVLYKEILAGAMLSLQQQCFAYLKELDGGCTDRLDEIEEFVSEKLCRRLPETFRALAPQQRAAALHTLLNRPLRVCGMVRNEGEPGGGPFWTEESDGGESLQIAESSQIAPDRKELMRTATHFNPVDLVCGVRDYRGRKFDLKRYVDPQTGFISSKSQQGRPLRALELPGLWNGAMSRWNTVFVEVPVSTFAPVKILNDLLRPQHLGD